MPIKYNLGYGTHLTPLNSYELSKIENNLINRCIMCREELSDESRTEEHIYPKWLQNRFNLWNQKIILPNGSATYYRQFTVPCCKQCNGETMSEWEKKIQYAVEKGYNEFIKLDEEIVVWWLLKIYYSKIVKESLFKENIKDPKSRKMITDEFLAKYNGIYFYMCELLKGVKFNDPKPYELYLFQSNGTNDFDYIDDISRQVLYMQLNDILIVCVFDSFKFFNMQYETEIKELRKLERVYPLQAIELFIKIVYFKSHYSYKTKHSYFIDEKGVFVNTEIINPKQINSFNLRYLHDMLIESFKMRGCQYDFPTFKDNSMISLILKHQE
ncbi:hypothetical protein [Clostridium estertheticum]|uniref:hypothetical protein n=1 Tax=Clostridium estertheticum TaxID=238834 RepID=UPI001C0BC74B|nr:hypothetical protein [Clostridium estertheticum]MBU3073868.1 hypothetical protein [Clostridium estertheticum]MBU3163963.1 hypothetical protein [Clostridium estertheticum]